MTEGWRGATRGDQEMDTRTKKQKKKKKTEDAEESIPINSFFVFLQIAETESLSEAFYMI